MKIEDALIKRAIEIIRQSSHASVSLLQRKLHLDYIEASRLMNRLEVMGIVGADEGSSKGRAVLKNDKPITQTMSSPESPATQNLRRLPAEEEQARILSDTHASDQGAVKASSVANGKTKAHQVEDEQLKSLLLEEILQELDSLVGLATVKKDVAELINFLRVQQLRKLKGLRTAPMSLHQVFYGNPGTGKTTVARLLSQIFKSLNLLSKGHLVETDRSGLVAGYVGQTALKVTDVVNKSLGGILFIDEAYSLAGQGNDFGQEAIETLLKQMEDHRDDLVVIVAGYTDRMNEFLSSNPGLRSRFNRYMRFEDYTPSQLVTIFESFSSKSAYHLSSSAKEKLAVIFGIAYERRDKAFGNGRFARNLFERSIGNQANRVVTLPDANSQIFSTIELADIPDEMIDELF